MNLQMQHDCLTTEYDFCKLARWRNEQPEILRSQKFLTPEDQKIYRESILKQDVKRFSNNFHMWGIVTWDEDYYERELIAYCGLTHIDWGPGFVVKAETSFISDTCITKDHQEYEEVFTYFLKEIKRLFFGNGYWNGERLYSETYDLPGRERHIEILERNGFVREGVLRNHVLRNGKLYDSIMHGLNRGDL